MMINFSNKIIQPNVGSGENESEYCVPFVSQYSDCTEDNLCTGCSECKCTAEGKWSCSSIQKCQNEDADSQNIYDDDMDNALLIFQSEMKIKEDNKKAASDYPLVPEPEKLDDEILEEKEFTMEDEILELMRGKRSTDDIAQEDGKENDTVNFHHAIDELNEDTLKNTNLSGTLPAQKVDALPQISRRTNNLLTNSSSSLHIEYTQPKENSHHDDNKVDTLAIHDDKEDLLVHSDFYNVVGNYSQENKDKELSKLLVNELKGGVSETIGDKNAPVISNITFTPENDTLTAMAFIAGNLLNRLWNMEKDASDDHIDTEVMKHEKIADLLDLFKDPLSMRQEMFLKNALEQLSTALNQNKDVDNISICKTLKDKKAIANNDVNKSIVQDKIDCNKVKQTKIENKNGPTAEALEKINNVLNLINKYEKVQNNISNMKSENIDKGLRANKNEEKPLTKDEKTSLDLYGKTLEIITKLLIPNRKNKKIVNLLNNGNQFVTGVDLKRKLSNMKLDNLNVTTKDKIVLDYLAHIQSNPDCLLKKQDKISLPSIEGNILLNLSEFFKIKSLADFVKLVETNKNPDTVLRLQVTTTSKPTKRPTTESKEKGTPKQFIDTKEKLKGHLKSILEDIIELQKAEGRDIKSKDTHIMEALPCIYNLLNAGKKEIIKQEKIFPEKMVSVDKNTRPSDKVREIFNNLKKELKFAQTRRSSTLNGPRPKSAVVWERMIKNAKGIQKSGTRRNLGNAPKTIEELKVYLDKIESSGSNTYKNYAYLYEVPPAERLLLLKTFNADTMKYVKAVKTIMATIPVKSSLTNDAVVDLNEFVDNVAMNINLNDKVVKNLDKPKKVNSFALNPKTIKNKVGTKLEQPTMSVPISYEAKLTRDKIINQLIKNRIQLYVDTKEATRETRNDMKYEIAKKILLHLEVGNVELARELYKVLASQKQMDSTIIENKNIDPGRKPKNRYMTRRKPLQVEPLLKFEDPKITNKDTQMVFQDQFIKQLLNLKNMKM